MPDHDDAPRTDSLRAAFEQVRASVMPSIRPPGTDRVTATVRRRRTVRSTVAAVAVVALAGTGAWVGQARAHRGAPTSTNPSASVGPTPATSPSATPDPSPSVTPTSPGSTSAGPSGVHHPPATGGAKPNCVTDGVAVAGADNTVRFSSLTKVQVPLCSGYRLTIYWASYTAQPDGSGRLYASGTTYLDATHPVRTVNPRESPTCGAWFVGHHWSSTPSSVSAYVMSPAFQNSPSLPFWDRKHNRNGLVMGAPAYCP